MAGSKKVARYAKPLSEAWLSRIWQRQLLSGHELITTDGKKVKVIFPGRRSREAGPDFCRAIILLNNDEPQRGDIELHICSSQWLEHKHQYDPAYNGVILHVVLQHDCVTLTPLQNGSLVSVLPLEDKISELRHLPRQSIQEPCPLRARRKADLARILNIAGEERFFRKASAFQVDINAFGPGQALYKGMMRALGYAHNKEPFEELARQVPLVELERRACAESPLQAVPVLQAYLIGSAGLLPQQRGISLADADPGNELDRIWHLIGRPQASITQRWRWRGVRPENWPMRRLAAASYLIAESSRQGLMATVLDNLASQRPKPEEVFMVPARGYWADHFDFGVAGARGIPLIGRGRAFEITVNVILPFIWAWGQEHHEPHLSSQAKELYKNYPKLAENQIIRLMKELLFPRSGLWLKSACQQQGLLHLYHTFCQDKKCADCCEWVKS